MEQVNGYFWPLLCIENCWVYAAVFVYERKIIYYLPILSALGEK